MIIIHYMNNNAKPLPRYATDSIVRALRTFPVVVVSGARQTGKSTLIRELLTTERREYRTLDDLDVLERAQQEPETLLKTKRPLTIDEIQRSPELLLAVKRIVDRQRQPGQFLLSGSANLALMRRVSETLAGRAVYLTLHPFTIGERAGLGTVGRWGALLDDPATMEGQYSAFSGLGKLLLDGGFPPAALAHAAK